ncbi:SAV_2336 N-terminal domain-related protein [Streptomyces genisteinicus]|uniref:Protein kinase domain-containing protein n=1 Tax=Streptomyces genisteinicus TaxID=2768068 RepID=A0A7H0I1T0_9ACTN|nr:SAV_2336 N-terminal domain-related protein [Streptomyces genisteinicus]QNP66746.1 hypothetical protein IAG43_30040 [Streptomyces genisteinicus]
MTAHGDLGRVRRALSGDGVLLHTEELLDALWLAERLPPAAATALARIAAAEPPPAPDPGPVGGAVPPPAGAPAASAAGEDDTAAARSGPDDGVRSGKETGLHAAPAPSHTAAPADRAAMAVRAPGAKALGGTELRLGRALRPLKQLRPDALRTELDIDATVTAMAETGLPEAVLRPATTRWLDLAVLVDDGVSMLLWQRLAGELRGLLQRSGAFRHVRVHGLDTRGHAGPRLRSRPYGASAATLALSTVLDPTGNTLLLVVSDGVGAAWRNGSMHEELRRAAATGPTAVVHALPRRLWAGTGLDARPWRVTTRRRGAANRSWHVEDPQLPAELAPFDGVPVPVLATDGDVVGAWAQLIGSPGGTAVLPLLTVERPAAPPPASVDRAATTGAAGAVLRFQDSASPDAYRLAAHLAAVAPLPVPVMRLVQHAVTPAVDTSHLAEVFLGGLMRGADETERPPHQRTFDFPEETRRILLGTVTPAELVRTARAVTDRLSELGGSPAGFPAWLPHSGGADRLSPGPRRPFGWVDETLMRRLGVSPPDDTGPEPPVPPPDEDLRKLPPGLPLVLDSERWRLLAVSDRRFEGRWALPYDVFAEYAWGDSGVFLAHDGEQNLLVVRRFHDEPDAHELMAREVQALQRMDGTCAPRLMAWDPDHERPWHAVRCALDGPAEPAPNLRDFTRSHGLLHHAGLLAVARQLAAGLARAHDRGLVHGSLTAGRVLIAGREVQITGWTTASVDGVPSRRWSFHGQRSRYRAPELGHATAAPTREADVYALGCVLVEAAVGPEHDGDLHGALESAKAWLEPAFLAALRACLLAEPDRRPTARQLRRALDSLASREAHPFSVVLGFDSELAPVRLDLHSETVGGDGPHLLCRGGPAQVRRAFLLRMLEQLSQQEGDGVEFILADYDRRSGFDRFTRRTPGSFFLGLRGGGPDVLSLCERLHQERRRREYVWDMESWTARDRRAGGPERLPRLVVAVDDFPRVHRLAPELFSALRQVAAAGPRLDIHLIMSADLIDLVATDEVFLGRSARIDLKSHTDASGASVADGAVLQVDPNGMPIRFTTGHE